MTSSEEIFDVLVGDIFVVNNNEDDLMQCIGKMGHYDNYCSALVRWDIMTITVVPW